VVSDAEPQIDELRAKLDKVPYPGESKEQRAA
jgi:hypothetical protein